MFKSFFYKKKTVLHAMANLRVFLKCTINTVALAKLRVNSALNSNSTFEPQRGP